MNTQDKKLAVICRAAFYEDVLDDLKEMDETRLVGLELLQTNMPLGFEQLPRVHFTRPKSRWASGA